MTLELPNEGVWEIDHARLGGLRRLDPPVAQRALDQLSNVVSRAVLRCRGGWIRAEHLRLPGTGVGDVVEADAAGLQLTVRQRAALEIAARHGRVRRADLVARFGVSGEAVRRDLSALTRAGLLRRQPVQGVIWYIASDGRFGG